MELHFLLRFDFGCQAPGLVLLFGLGRRMKPTICICCGEEIAKAGNALSRNPNLCASCSSLADGMEEPSIAALDPHELSMRYTSFDGDSQPPRERSAQKAA